MRFEFNDDSQKICNSADVVNYGIQCDICGNKVLSVSNINGKRYCAGCYYKTFMKDNQKAEIDQLKQQLEEYKNKENTSAVNSWDEMLKNCENCGLNECIGCEYTQTCVQNIKQQLAEKDTRIEELEGQFAYECECNKQLVELQKQLEKKQNEIDEINKEFVQAVHDWKALCADKDEEIELLNAMISTLPEHDKEIKEYELEKVKDFILENTMLETETAAVLTYIYQQIKELKGEKDVED